MGKPHRGDTRHPEHGVRKHKCFTQSLDANMGEYSVTNCYTRILDTNMGPYSVKPHRACHPENRVSKPTCTLDANMGPKLCEPNHLYSGRKHGAIQCDTAQG